MQNCVYRFLNKDNEIIYIGKAKILKNRLRGHRHLPKECYAEITTIEFSSFQSKYEMDLAERYLIPKYKPKYNIAMSDGIVNLNISEFDNINWINLQDYYKELEEQKKKKLESKQKKSIKSEFEIAELENKDLVNSKIICVFTGVIFENIISLHEYVVTKISLRKLIDYCNGKPIGKHIKIKHPNYPNCPMMARFMDIYNNSDDEDKEFYKDVQKRFNRQIYCITTNELFDNILKASYKYKTNTYVDSCCEGKSKYIGVFEDKPLVWVWYDDYLNMTSYEISERMNRALSLYEKRNKNKK